MSVNSQYPSRKQTKRCATLILHFVILTVHTSFVVGSNSRSTMMMLCCCVCISRTREWRSRGSRGKGESSCIRSYFLRCTVHQTESCWKYKSSDSFFFAYTYCRYIVFSSTITYLVVHKYTYNASRPHKSTIRLRFTWHLPLDIDIWEELYITNMHWWDSW